jgi:hypothetical protein
MLVGTNFGDEWLILPWIQRVVDANERVSKLRDLMVAAAEVRHACTSTVHNIYDECNTIWHLGILTAAEMRHTYKRALDTIE